MIENIKSRYIKKIIFSFIDEKVKLEIIKYNHNLKECLNINIYNYMQFSNRYIIYETKKKGKEYSNDGELKFEGEYLNGKKNGKGKEYNYYDGLLKFEGEFLNGIKNGKGKEYNNNGKLLYDGEYLNGKKNGKGKAYYHNGKLEFVGEYLNGKKWTGKQYGLNNNNIYELKNGNGFQKIHNIYPGFCGQLEFEGEFLNGIKNGKGKEYFENTLIFEGEYLNGKIWNGKFYDKIKNNVYEIKNGKGFIKRYNLYGILKFEGYKWAKKWICKRI